MGTTNPVYYQNTAETVSLDNLPTGQISWNTWQYLWSPQLSTRDVEHLNRLWHSQMWKNMQPKRPSSEKPQLRGWNSRRETNHPLQKTQQTSIQRWRSSKRN